MAGHRAFAPGLGWLHIETVDVVKLKQLTDVDARADGFETVSDMLKTLREIYPNRRSDGRRWFRVGFRWDDVAGKAPAKKAGTANRTRRRRKHQLIDKVPELFGGGVSDGPE